MFTSVDPHYFNYPSISPYVYAANNPLLFTDPDGKDIRITRSDEEKTIVVEGNFYYSASQIDPSGNYGIVEAFEANLASWAADITNSMSSMGMEDYSVSVIFNMKEVDVGGLTGEKAIEAVRNVANADEIGNSLIHDSKHPRASVKGNKHLTANMSLARHDRFIFSGIDGYQGTLKHEIGHFFGLRDNTINGDLMNNTEAYRNNAVQPFIRVMQWNGLNQTGSRSVLFNSGNREPLR